MTWDEYYEKYDDWPESTQYGCLSFITNFGPKGSPSAEIAECIEFVDQRTASSLLHRALAAGVRFRASEITDIVDSGQIENQEILVQLIHAVEGSYTGEQLATLFSCFADEQPVYDLLAELCAGSTQFTEQDVVSLLPEVWEEEEKNRLVASTDTVFSEGGVMELCDAGISEELLTRIARRSGLPYGAEMPEEAYIPATQIRANSRNERIVAAQTEAQTASRTVMQKASHVATQTAAQTAAHTAAQVTSDSSRETLSVEKSPNDNYDNGPTIRMYEKVLERLRKKRHPDAFQIKLTEEKLKEARLFKSCQIFQEGFLGLFLDPGPGIMFSDSNQLLWLQGVIIRYQELESYALVEDVQTATRRRVNKGNLINSAVFGKVVFDDPLLGIWLNPPEEITTTYQSKDGYILYVRLINNSGYQVKIPRGGFFGNKMRRSWQRVCAKLSEIIAAHTSSLE